MIDEGTVSISPRGSMGIARDLNRSEMVDYFGRPAYDPDRRLLRITLTKERYSAYCFRDDWPRMRIEPIQAMKDFGVLPAERIVCPAWWEGADLYVQLPPVEKATAKVRRTPEASDMASLAADAERKAHEAKPAVWVGKTMCPDCGEPVAYRMVDGVRWTRSHKNPKGQACEAMALPTTQPCTATPPEITQDIATVAYQCAVCKKRLPGVMRSDGVHPMAHRVGGKICPGVFQVADA